MLACGQAEKKPRSFPTGAFSFLFADFYQPAAVRIATRIFCSGFDRDAHRGVFDVGGQLASYPVKGFLVFDVERHWLTFDGDMDMSWPVATVGGEGKFGARRDSGQMFRLITADFGFQAILVVTAATSAATMSAVSAGCRLRPSDMAESHDEDQGQNFANTHAALLVDFYEGCRSIIGVRLTSLKSKSLFSMVDVLLEFDYIEFSGGNGARLQQ